MFRFENLTSQDIHHLTEEYHCDVVPPTALLHALRRRKAPGTRHSAYTELVALSLLGDRANRLDSMADCLLIASAILDPVLCLHDITRGLKRLGLDLHPDADAFPWLEQEWSPRAGRLAALA